MVDLRYDRGVREGNTFLKSGGAGGMLNEIALPATERALQSTADTKTGQRAA